MGEDLNRISCPVRFFTLGAFAGTGPSPMKIDRSGKWPFRTTA